MIRGFREYENDEFLQEYLLRGDAGTSLELKENNSPIVYVETGEGRIKLTARVRSVNQYITLSECQGVTHNGVLKVGESCILKNNSFYYNNMGRVLKVKVVLDTESSSGEVPGTLLKGRISEREPLPNSGATRLRQGYAPAGVKL